MLAQHCGCPCGFSNIALMLQVRFQAFSMCTLLISKPFSTFFNSISQRLDHALIQKQLGVKLSRCRLHGVHREFQCQPLFGLGIGIKRQ